MRDKEEIRRIAEKYYFENKKNLDDLSKVDMKTLIEELQIHQIELEMQNRELKEAYESLDLSKKKYWELYNLSPAGYISITNEMVIKEINLTAINLIKEDKTKIIGRKITEFIDKEFQDIFYIFFNEIKNSKKHNICELIIRDVHNKPIWILLFGEFVFDYNNEFEIRLSLIDITLKKEYDYVNNLFKKIFDISPNANYIMELDGTIVDWNNGASTIFGYDQKEMIGKSIYILVPDDYYENVRSFFENLRSKEFVLNYDTVKIAKGGRRLYLKNYSYIIFNSVNNKKYIYTLEIDITKQKIYEDNLKRINEELEERIEMEVIKNMENEKIIMNTIKQVEIGNITNMLVHQWRQPLNNISLILQNIDEKVRENQEIYVEVKDYFDKTYSMINFLTESIEDFRNFFSYNKIKSKISIKNALNKILKFVEDDLKSSKINVIIEIIDDFELDVYKNDLLQLFLVFIQNAKEEFINQNITYERFIKFRTYYNDNKKIISISDNAGGIPVYIIDKIFEKNFTTKQNGTGLGLYIANLIIENDLKGKIFARNIDKGAEFIIEIP